MVPFRWLLTLFFLFSRADSFALFNDSPPCPVLYGTGSLRLGLSNLLTNPFADIPYPFPFIRVRGFDRSKFGGDDSHLLPVDSSHIDLGLFFNGDLDPIWKRK